MSQAGDGNLNLFIFTNKLLAKILTIIRELTKKA